MSVPVNSATTNYYDYAVSYNYYNRTVTITDASSYVGAGVGSQSYTFTTPSGTVLTGTIIPSTPVPLVFNMGYMGASIQVGNYSIAGVFTDADDATYPLTKTTNLCLPKQNSSSTAANGCVTLGWTVRCIDNLIIVADQTPFVLTVNGTVYQSSTTTYGITCVNPLGVVLASNVNVPSFQITPIVNGGYNININDTAVFSVGDLVTVTVHFVLLGTIKQAQCNINLCDVYCAVDDVYNQWLAVQGTGSIQERTLYRKWNQLALLIGQAQIAITCGNDVSAKLLEIEAISGVACSCGCGISNVSQGVNVALGQNIVIQGGDNITITETTVGNTTTFTINGYAYVIESDTLTVTSATVGTTITYTLEESGKVKADSTDTAPNYLYDKLESIDGSVTITDDTVGTHQVDLSVAPTKTVLFNDEAAYPLTNIGQFNSYAMPANTVSANGNQLEIDVFLYTSALVGDTPQWAFQINGVTLFGTAFGSTTQAVKANIKINRTAAGTAKYTVQYEYYGAPSLGIYPVLTPAIAYIPATALVIDFTNIITFSTRFTVDSGTAITMTNLGFVVKHFKI